MTAKRFPQPSSVDGIKRLAKRLKTQDKIPHMKALDAAARHAGFSNFIDAKRRLARATSAAGLATPKKPKGNPMPLEDFHRERRDAWDRAIASLAGPNSPATIVWKGRADIAAALEPLMGINNNHAHLPTGGGMDFEAVRRSAEPGCLEFLAGGRTGYIVKPRKLTLERIDSPGNSFLLLELDELAPTDTYDDGEDQAEDEEVAKRDRGSEELLEVAPGEYEDRGLWDRGFLGYDEGGREIPMPDEARIVVRWLRGKILFVAKGSLWNGSPRTYGGEHDKFSAYQIRQAIERALAEEDA